MKTIEVGNDNEAYRTGIKAAAAALEVFHTGTIDDFTAMFGGFAVGMVSAAHDTFPAEIVPEIIRVMQGIMTTAIPNAMADQNKDTPNVIN